MKPRNKYQKRVADLSAQLPKFSAKQIQWGYTNCIEHIGRKTAKGVITCCECTHKWQGEIRPMDHKEKGVCPNCNAKLTIVTTRKSTFYDYEYLCVITTSEEFQVLRFLFLESHSKVGEKPRFSHVEAVQRWIAPDGKNITITRLRPMGYFVHGWSYHSTLEIRANNDNKYNIVPTLYYPEMKLIPELKRTGFKGRFFNMRPFNLIHTLLTDSKSETLLKAGLPALIKHFMENPWRKIEKYWPSIRIAIRNGYKIKDTSLWLDYLNTLEFIGKDLRNAKYVCPENLRMEHDKAMMKKERIEIQRELEQNMSKYIEQEPMYAEMIAKYYGLNFNDGKINVHLLESVKDVMIEGKVLHHCVYRNGYYKNPDTLLLSATVDGKKIETVEFSLAQMKVVQCRGLQNGITKYHKQIIDLVNKNIPLIQKRLTA